MPQTCPSASPLPPLAGPRFVDDYLLYLMARASFVVSAEFHAQLRRRNVSVPVWRVLGCLIGSGGETVTGLAETCLLQQPTMTKLLDRMERDGLVRRTPDLQDRRVVRVALTARGAELADELAGLAKQHEAEVLTRYPNAEAPAIKDLLRAILGHHHGRVRRC